MAGVVPMTAPAATVVEYCWVCVGTRPAALMAVAACVYVFPATVGTGTGFFPWDTATRMVDPYGASVTSTFVLYDQLMICPSGTVPAVVYASSAGQVALKWASWSSRVAALHVSPASDGTATDGRPLDGTTWMTDPSFNCVPAAGVCLITDVAATVMECSAAATSRVKWSATAAFRAAVRVVPASFGAGWLGVNAWLAAARPRAVPAAASTTTPAPTSHGHFRRRFWRTAGGGDHEWSTASTSKGCAAPPVWVGPPTTWVVSPPARGMPATAVMSRVSAGPARGTRRGNGVGGGIEAAAASSRA